MTTALIITATFLPLVGFIAGALWERRKNGRHIRSVLDRAKQRRAERQS
jgi:hypothetical protein